MTDTSCNTISVVDSINDSDTETWSQWSAENAIFMQPEFLSALEASQSVSPATGWQSNHLAIYQGQQLQAFMPMFIKNHSYGEYMFDWQWANGFHRAGLQYYPKAVNAVPFTPVSSARLLSSDGNGDHYQTVVDYVQQQDVSNFQCLYTTQDESELWRAAGALVRHGYQFTWYNKNYHDFDHFLAQLRSSYRKKIRRERRQIATSRLHIKRFYGAEITPEVWHFFIICYKRTYLKRSGHEGYLNQAFFNLIRKTMTDNLLVIIAEYDGEPIAASLCFVAGDTLYGRYWGTLHELDGLHFEVCYYQGIEFCIEQGLQCYHPGTQGEYKRRRGFIPEYTYGAYIFNTANIRPAIEDYLQHEFRGIQYQMDDWNQSSPYKVDNSKVDNS
ncbi:MAG: GNAT family N-acetyltransferase [Gammaproteobacteria bacterium]